MGKSKDSKTKKQIDKAAKKQDKHKRKVAAMGVGGIEYGRIPNENLKPSKSGRLRRRPTFKGAFSDDASTLDDLQEAGLSGKTSPAARPGKPIKKFWEEVYQKNPKTGYTVKASKPAGFTLGTVTIPWPSAAACAAVKCNEPICKFTNKVIWLDASSNELDETGGTKVKGIEPGAVQKPPLCHNTPWIKIAMAMEEIESDLKDNYGPGTILSETFKQWFGWNPTNVRTGHALCNGSAKKDTEDSPKQFTQELKVMKELAILECNKAKTPWFLGNTVEFEDEQMDMGE